MNEFTTSLAGERRRLPAVGVSLAVTLGVLVPAAPHADSAGVWLATGSLSVPRELATASLLPDGNVLVAGGGGNDADNVYRTRSTAEIYSAASGTWAVVSDPMVAARRGHTATTLANGKVLLAGGANDDPTGLTIRSAELYDPSAGTFTETGSMTVGRQGHTATLLNSGQVLVVGGSPDEDGETPLGSAELYNPVTGIWAPTGHTTGWPPIARVDNRANLLATGEVLLTGDQPVQRPAAELYQPSSGRYFFTGAMPTERRNHTATRLLNGNVLVQGGAGAASGGRPDRRAEVFEPDTFDPGVSAFGHFRPTGNVVHGSRRSATATLLPDGTVLLAGGTGVTESDATPVAELYNPKLGTWSEVGAMAGTRLRHTATLLRTGRVLIVGGARGAGGKVLRTAELYKSPQLQRTVSLSLEGHVVASGLVTGSKPCRQLVEVTIRRNGVVIATATTAQDGTYRVTLPDVVASYQAVVTPAIVDDIPCAKASSATVSHQH